jgi:hypothetical protein
MATIKTWSLCKIFCLFHVKLLFFPCIVTFSSIVIFSHVIVLFLVIVMRVPSSVFCVLFVCKCILLPPGVNPIAAK